MAVVRGARPDDGRALQAIEVLAGERFREVGLGYVADHEPASVDELTAYAADGRSWVAVDGDDTPIGYALADVVDGQAHLEQMSVLPDRQGSGVGQALIDQVRTWALAAGRTQLTLTTFTDVAWNRPLYEHLGFRVLADDEIGPELRALQATEAAHGLDPATRVAMRLDLSADGPRPQRDHAASPGAAPPSAPRRRDWLVVATLVAGFVPWILVGFGFWGFLGLVPVIVLGRILDRRRFDDPRARTSKRVANTALVIALTAVAVGLALFFHRPDSEGVRNIHSIRVGECFDWEPGAQARVTLLVVSCSGTHLGEATLNEMDPNSHDDTYPGADVLHEHALAACKPAFEDYVGVPSSDSELRDVWYTPNEQAWASPSERRILCSAQAAHDAGLPAGTVRGSNR